MDRGRAKIFMLPFWCPENLNLRAVTNMPTI